VNNFFKLHPFSHIPMHKSLLCPALLLGPKPQLQMQRSSPILRLRGEVVDAVKCASVWLFVAAKNGDYTKALDVYASYEEQNVLPRTRTLRYLAKLLQSHDQEVPFEVPTTAQVCGHFSDRSPRWPRILARTQTPR